MRELKNPQGRHLPAPRSSERARAARRFAPATLADYEAAIIEMMCANFAPDKFMERMAARDAFAAVPDGDIIGTVSFSLPRCQALFPVHRTARPAAGIGKRLVQHIEQHARTLGCTDLQLSASITAKPFYERLGYATKRFEERVDDGSTWLMSKRLRQPWRARMHAASGPHLAARLPRRSENAYHLRWFVRHPGSPGSMEVTDGRCNGSLARC